MATNCNCDDNLIEIYQGEDREDIILQALKCGEPWDLDNPKDIIVRWEKIDGSALELKMTATPDPEVEIISEDKGEFKVILTAEQSALLKPYTSDSPNSFDVWIMDQSDKKRNCRFTEVMAVYEMLIS